MWLKSVCLSQLKAWYTCTRSRWYQLHLILSPEKCWIQNLGHDTVLLQFLNLKAKGTLHISAAILVTVFPISTVIQEEKTNCAILWNSEANQIMSQNKTANSFFKNITKSYLNRHFAWQHQHNILLKKIRTLHCIFWFAVLTIITCRDIY